MDVSAALQNLTGNLSVEEKATVIKELSAYLNYLVLNDFPALVQILYRVDISEKKLRTALAENKEADAGDLLAELIIERQQQKIFFKGRTSSEDDITGEERW
ncbi:MAG: hypothetical protein ACXWC7_14095 [Chitinophagaceae bacterium]